MEEQLGLLTATSTPDAKREFERWDHSNHISLMIMSTTFQKPLRAHNLKRLLRPRGQGNVREYIMKMFHIASRFKELKIELSEELIVPMILVSLPTQFYQFTISYNCRKEKWTLNEHISHCVQEEERLKHYKS
ncbi:retrovirus-related Pol polyprotein from transposon TNT 1-94 [Gossypium australe]|uniref:Retrovirus-related Pol polyprotein from transposon TNT 1-94 n=1 Tax=Gossypium australe TaxID=47621 RepID=A0A5B6W325_9ROSI|nr:retrovirus-related Pol polyprotein from transposon TNT 1-94 [Gossypium australe]